MSALDALISNFKANSNVMPQVNPPAAAKVLETQTKPETEGKPEPAVASAALTPSAAAAATAPSAASGAASEPEGKPRRTAAVVQAELDLVAAELAQTKAALRRVEGLELEARNQLSMARSALEETKAELEKAVEFAKSVVADNAKLAEQSPEDASGEPFSIESAAAFLKAKGYGIFTLGGS